MFNVGGPEIMVVLLVALVVLGPEQLPKAMRTFGNVMAQIRKVSDGFQSEMRSAMNTLEAPSQPSQQQSSRPSGAGDRAGVSGVDAPPPSEAPVVETVARNEPGPAAPAAAQDQAPSGASAADRAAG